MLSFSIVSVYQQEEIATVQCENVCNISVNVLTRDSKIIGIIRSGY